jgi:Sec-independent protein translocase protein TatA
MKKLIVAALAALCLLGTSSLLLADDAIKGEMGNMKDEMKAEKDTMKGEMKAKRHETEGKMKAHKDAARPIPQPLLRCQPLPLLPRHKFSQSS